MFGSGSLAKVLGILVLAPLLAAGSMIDHSVVRPALPETALLHPEHLKAPTLAPPTTTWSQGDPVMLYGGHQKELAFHLPASLALRDGAFDLLVHFHGPHATTMTASDQAEVGAVVVSFNLGDGGSRYGAAAATPDFFDRLVALAEREVAKSGRAPGARVGRIALSSWSAGFGAVREVMRRPENAERVDAILLADGFFTDWTSAKRAPGSAEPAAVDADFEKVQAVIDFAERAKEGEKLFVLTHTAIDRHDYPDAPNVALALLHQFELPKGFGDAPPNASGASQRYGNDVEGFHIWGSGGKTWGDHVAQHRSMGSRQYAALRSFWRTAE